MAFTVLHLTSKVTNHLFINAWKGTEQKSRFHIYFYSEPPILMIYMELFACLVLNIKNKYDARFLCLVSHIKCTLMVNNELGI